MISHCFRGAAGEDRRKEALSSSSVAKGRRRRLGICWPITVPECSTEYSVATNSVKAMASQFVGTAVFVGLFRHDRQQFSELSRHMPLPGRMPGNRPGQLAHAQQASLPAEVEILRNRKGTGWELLPAAMRDSPLRWRPGLWASPSARADSSDTACWPARRRQGSTVARLCRRTVPPPVRRRSRPPPKPLSGSASLSLRETPPEQSCGAGASKG